MTSKTHEWRGVAAVFVAVLACGWLSAVAGAQESDSAASHQQEATSQRVAPSEVLARIEFPSKKNWSRIKSGAVLEGRLGLALYEGREMKAPAGTPVQVKIESVEKIRDEIGFWKKTGRAVIRAFNPIETNHPSMYRVNLTWAALAPENGQRVDLGHKALLGRSGVMIEAPEGASHKTPAKNKPAAMLMMGLTASDLPHQTVVSTQTTSGEIVTNRHTRAYMLSTLRASTNHEGDRFEAVLAEPARIGGRVFPAGATVEGAVVRQAPPKMLSRAGKLNLRFDRVRENPQSELAVDGAITGAEADGQMAFAVDEEGTLRGRKPGVVNGLIDLGYAYFVGKIADDISEAPIRAIGGVMSDAAVANAARYVGITTAVIFLITRHGRDVFVPEYAVVDIDFGR